jgi:hypothetical protein
MHTHFRNLLLVLALIAIHSGVLAADELGADGRTIVASAGDNTLPVIRSDKGELLKSIETSWTGREERARRLIVKWTEHRTYFPGAFVNFDGGPGYPEQETSFDVTCSCTLNGDDFRLEEKGLHYSGRIHRFTPMHRVVSHHQSLDQTYFGMELPEGKQSFQLNDCPVGFSKTEKQSSEFNSPVLYPIVLHYRPLSANFRRFELNAAQILDRTGMIGNSECILLTPKKSESPYEYEYWLDPGLQYAVRRVNVKTNGTLDLKIDVEYHKNHENDVVPTRWTRMGFRGESVQTYQCEAEIVDVEFPESLDDSATAFEFPSGTLIEHGDTNLRLLVLDDGSLRPVTDAENAQGIPYDTLMRTKPNEALNFPEK